MFEDDPDAPVSEEEKRAAAALRNALEPEPGAPPGALKTAEAKWLAAHLRRPTAEDSLGEVRAWRLARGAREAMQQRRGAAEPHRDGLSRLGRSLTSTGGLLAAAAMLLIVSWLIVGQGQRLGSSPLAGRSLDGGGPSLRTRSAVLSQRAAQTMIFRGSLKHNESPAQRIDLMIEARLAELRSPPRNDLERANLRSFSAAALSSLGAPR